MSGETITITITGKRLPFSSPILDIRAWIARELSLQATIDEAEATLRVDKFLLQMGYTL